MKVLMEEKLRFKSNTKTAPPRDIKAENLDIAKLELALAQATETRKELEASLREVTTKYEDVLGKLQAEWSKQIPF